jgi:DNA polymerase delta subunit 1
MDTTYRPETGKHAVIEIHGVTREGYSVWVNVENFLPNFFIRLRPNQNAQRIREDLERSMQRKFFNDRKYGGRTQYIEQWVRVQNVRSIMHFRRPSVPGSAAAADVFYQVFMNHPKHIAAARDFLVSGTSASHHSMRVEETFEANVLYDLRYMVDYGLHGCQWVTYHNISIRTQDDPRRVSRAQIEVAVQANDTMPLQGIFSFIPANARLRRAFAGGKQLNPLKFDRSN